MLLERYRTQVWQAATYAAADSTIFKPLAKQFLNYFTIFRQQVSNLV
jgi:hypothetical protein